MEFSCLLCRTLTSDDVNKYFCPGCKACYSNIEIELDNEVLFPLSEADHSRLNKSLRPNGTKQKPKKLLKKLKSIQSNPIHRIKASTDDQNSLNELMLNQFPVFKIHRNSKKIHKRKGQHNLLGSEMSFSNTALCSNTASNYSNLGNNKNSEKFEPELLEFPSLSRDSTDAGSHQAAPGSPNQLMMEEKSYEAGPKYTLLNPEDLFTGDSSDSDHSPQFEENANTRDQHKTNEQKEVSYGDNSTKNDSGDNRIYQGGSDQNSYFVDSAVAIKINKSAKANGKILTEALKKNGDSNEEVKKQLCDFMPEEELSADEDIMIGEKYQCAIPTLLDRSQIMPPKRQFKFRSDPTEVNLEVLEMIEQFTRQHLKIQNLHPEKLLLLLREHEYKIPEFFAGLIQNKESCQKRLNWRKERRFI